MGIEFISEGKVKCDHCKKKKIDVFKVVNNQYYCSECYEKLGGKDFRDAIRELDERII